MAGNKPNVVIFGAGMTGRGHIAQLAFEGGWSITFVDRNPELIKLLNNAGKYTVHLISDNPRDVIISDYKAIHTDNKNAIAEAVSNSDLVITSVLATNLSGVAPLLAEGLKLRLTHKKEPLNIIAAENVNEGSSMLWSLTSPYLSAEEQQQYGKAFGFPNSMVARVVPRSLDPLYIITEDYNEWTADMLNCAGDPPSVNGLEWVQNQEARLKRKLFIHNTGHAICAYLGVIKGYKFIHESAQDEWVLSWVDTATTESGSAVAREFGFDEGAIRKYAHSLTDRLPKDALPDGIDRVVREPIRKLGLNDRLLGPLALCEKHDLPRDGLCLGIAAVLASKIDDDEGSRLSNLIKENGAIKALTIVSNYKPDAETSRKIEMYYDLLSSLAFSSISQTNKPKYDVLGLGIVAVDDLFMVDNYPPPDAKLKASGLVRQGGGLTGTALVASSRLGAKSAYGGILGQDELSNWTVSELEKEGVDCSLTIRSMDVQPYHAIIIVDTTHHTRNIIYTDIGVSPRPVDTVDESFVSQAKVILIDQLGIDVMLKTALIAKKLGIPTIADIEREDHPKTRELLAQIDHLILSTSFAGKLTGTDDPVEQVRIAHNNNDRICTAVTVGVKGCWYIKKDQPDEIHHQPAFKVKTVDTTGCGDVFHGAYAAGLAWGWSVDDCIKFAAATSALKATKPGGRAGIPDKQTVEKFLKGNPETYT
jgi:sugar/nucleoside kinase (ribokinase family)/mannitol-1-phosphate/altronate dehydrogenase